MLTPTNTENLTTKGLTEETVRAEKIGVKVKFGK